jgi:hypothetical protein
MGKRLLVVPAGISLVAGTVGTATASAGQAARPGPMASAPAAFFDPRVSAAPRHATVTQTAAVRGMVRAIGSSARITYDPLFGTPRQLLRYGGYLTGPGQR